MAPPVAQPTLPAEGSYTDLEQLFIAEQPKKLWPENQNSNLGALRKVLTDSLTVALTQIAEMLTELSVELSEGYLTRWESQVNVPQAPANLSLDERRTIVFGRLQKGLFTRERREAMIRKSVEATIGDAPSFTADGISLTSDGVSLFSDVVSPEGAYEIIENVENFSYEIRILASMTLDMANLQRELGFITPAGISFTVTNALTPFSLLYPGSDTLPGSDTIPG